MTCLWCHHPYHNGTCPVHCVSFAGLPPCDCRNVQAGKDSDEVRNAAKKIEES